MRNIYLLMAMVCVCLTACTNKESKPASDSQRNGTAASQDVRYDCKTIEVDGGWGYDIYVDGNLYVHQVHIPAIPGMHPFVSESDAWNAGSFAVKKMKDGIVPPTITIEEMQTLGIVLPPQN